MSKRSQLLVSVPNPLGAYLPVKWMYRGDSHVV